MIWRGHPTFEPRRGLVDDDVLREAERHPARTAIVDARSGRALTFGQLADGARRVAGGLAERGVGHRDVVAIVAANGPDYAVALYGALAAGAVVESANPALTASELAHHFGIGAPKLVFTDEQSDAAVRAVHDNPVRLDRLGALLAAPRPHPAQRRPDDPAWLFPSSGTTGLPKLAVHTHASTTAFLDAFMRVELGRLLATDVVAVAIPFGHLFGSAIVTEALVNGATVVTTPTFALDEFLRMLQDHAVTVVPATPPLVAALARHPLVDRFDLSALRLVIASAAPCAPELQEAVQARLGCVVGDYLGLTEAWCVAPAASPVVRGSVGRLAPNVEAMIVDPDSGEPLGPDARGELWLRGPQLMAGYVGADPLDGWYATGDLCRFDAAGNLYMLDRLKELIKVGGSSVAPAEVERELVAHPAVADAAVVGRAHAELGEVPVAFVSLHADTDPAELHVWLADRLAPWKRPREVVVVERVPRTPAGKLLRRAFQSETSRPSSDRRETPSLANAVDR
ncbi:MAG TPA: AMP-binding protein [Solirubrobacter sp.]|nr:AMP-binding protein [Solirubrobacter sp.]